MSEPTHWCVLAYRATGGMEVHGPYLLRGFAATAAVVIEARAEYEAAHVAQMVPGEVVKWETPPQNRNTQWDDLRREEETYGG